MQIYIYIYIYTQSYRYIIDIYIYIHIVYIYIYIYLFIHIHVYNLISSVPTNKKDPQKHCRCHRFMLLFFPGSPEQRKKKKKTAWLSMTYWWGGKWQDPYNGLWNNPHINGLYNPYNNLNNQGSFFIAHVQVKQPLQLLGSKKNTGPAAPHRCHCPQWAVHLLRLDLPARRPPQPGISPQTHFETSERIGASAETGICLP